MKYLEAKPFLKKGMTVIRTKGECCADEVNGKPLQIDGFGDCVKPNGKHCSFLEDYELEILTNPDGSKWVHPLKAVEDYPMWMSSQSYSVLNDDINRYVQQLYKTINEPKAQKGIIMNVVDKIKNFKLTKEDRILRENGLEDEDGKMTESSIDMMDDEMIAERWATRRLQIAKDLLDIKAEEK